MQIRRYSYFFAIPLLLAMLNCSDDESSTNSKSAGQVNLIQTYGGTKNDSGKSVVATLDGGYIVLGYTQSKDVDITDKQDESFDYWLLKFNVENDFQWQKTYGGSKDDRGSSVIQTQDGGYAILGYSSSSDGDVSNNAGLQDYWLAKLDASGNILWQKSFGYQGSDSGISIIETRDQGYLISGILDITASGGEGNTDKKNSKHAGGDYWVIKLSVTGNIEWSKYFGGNFTDTPENIIQTVDNGFIIIGASDSNDTDISNNLGTYDFWVIKISATGTLIWEKSFGGQQIDTARAIVRASDGNYIIAGDTRSNDNDISNNIGAADLWLIKISPLGDLIWEKTIGGTNFDVAHAMAKTQDNGFLIAGSSRSSDGDVFENKGQNDAWVLKIDNSGNLVWEKTIGGSNIDFAYGIATLNDNSIVVVGDSSSNDGDINENRGFSDLLLIRID